MKVSEEIIIAARRCIEDSRRLDTEVPGPSIACVECLSDALDDIELLTKIVVEVVRFHEFAETYWCWPIFGPYSDDAGESLDKILFEAGLLKELYAKT